MHYDSAERAWSVNGGGATIYIYIYLAQGSRHEWFKAEPKTEEGLKPERGESRPTAAVL